MLPRWCSWAPLHQDTTTGSKASVICCRRQEIISHRIFFLVTTWGEKNRFVKVTQKFEWSEATELSKLQSFLKLPKCPGNKLQQPQEAQSCSQVVVLHNLSAPFPGTLPLQCLLTASSKKLIDKTFRANLNSPKKCTQHHSESSPVILY